MHDTRQTLLGVARYALKKPERLLHYLRTGYVAGIQIQLCEQHKLVYVLNPKSSRTNINAVTTGTITSAPSRCHTV